MLCYFDYAHVQLPAGVAHAAPAVFHSTLSFDATHVLSFVFISAGTFERLAGKW